jgi:hypothetical protein
MKTSRTQLLRAIAIATALSASAAKAADAPAPFCAPGAKAELFCQGATCMRVPAAMLCQRLRETIAAERPRLDDGQRALARLIASVQSGSTGQSLIH